MNREIMLMRHGQPAGVNRNRVSARQMKEWIDHYNRSEIDRQPIPQASVQLAATARVVVSSTAPRALSSVLALGLQPQLVDAVSAKRSSLGQTGNAHGYRPLPGLLSFVSYGFAVVQATLKLPPPPASVPRRPRESCSPWQLQGLCCCSVMV